MINFALKLLSPTFWKGLFRRKPVQRVRGRFVQNARRRGTYEEDDRSVKEALAHAVGKMRHMSNGCTIDVSSDIIIIEVGLNVDPNNQREVEKFKELIRSGLKAKGLL